MWNHRYWGQAYWGQAYWGDAIGDLAPYDPYAVESNGSYVPDLLSAGRAGYTPTTQGSYRPNISSGGTP